MHQQYKLSITPSCSGYADIESSSVILTAQIALDLSNLVGASSIYPKNPIVVEAINKIEVAIEKTRQLGSYIDGDESRLVDAAKAYINGIKSGNNSQSAYDNLLKLIHVATPIQKI